MLEANREIGKEKPEKNGVIFVIIKCGKIQLEKRMQIDRPFFGYTIIPGGRIETGETQEDALIREVKEERGINVLGCRKIGIVDTRESDGTLNVRHVFRVTKWSGRMHNPEKRNKYLEATPAVARLICAHPISQRILSLIEEDLAREHKKRVNRNSV